MDQSNTEESVAFQKRADDRFFVIATAILPFVAQAAYLFDVYYYHNYGNTNSSYEGLLSSILSVFVYLQYSVPFRSRRILLIYHSTLWVLSEIGTFGHVVYYTKKKDTLHLILYATWGVIDTMFFICLIYCRVFSKHRGLYVHMPLEQSHLFHFISRLEVILAIFIPVFFDSKLVTLTKDNIAFYILFDFFAESYDRFRGVRIKGTLYAFVMVVTASVATEWIHIVNHDMKYEKISLICEIVAACLCDSLIIMQFFPSNFLPDSIHRRNKKHGTSSTSFASSLAIDEKNQKISVVGKDSIGTNSDTDVSYF